MRRNTDAINRPDAFPPGLDQRGQGIIAVVREWTGGDAPACTPAAKELEARVETALPHDNVLRLPVEYRSGGIDVDCDTHDDYLGRFRQLTSDRLQQLVNTSVEADPEIKSRKKMVQEVYAESMAHFALLRQLPLADEGDEAVERVKRLILAGAFTAANDPPVCTDAHPSQARSTSTGLS